MAFLRPTFMFNGNPVRAAGILIFTFDRGRRMILFRDIDGRYEDIGGKTDQADSSFVDTAVREAAERQVENYFTLLIGCMIVKIY